MRNKIIFLLTLISIILIPSITFANLEGITLNKNRVTIMQGNNISLAITNENLVNNNSKIIWTSSDENIAKVSKSGEVTAISPGRANVIVTTENNRTSATCNIIVTSIPAEKISFKEESIIIYLEETKELQAELFPEDSAINNPIWESSNNEVVSVYDGIITANKVGTATIKVTEKNTKISDSIEVIVSKKPKEELKIIVEGYNLNFDKNITNYEINIKKEKSLKISINREDVTPTIIGNENLKTGSMITIKIDGKDYYITINKKNDYTLIFISIISILLLINLIRVIKKNKKKEYDW